MKETRHSLVAHIYGETGADSDLIRRVLDTALSRIGEALADGREVELRGFGRFALRYKKEKRGARNFKTGETMVVKARCVPYWKPCKAIDDAVSILKAPFDCAAAEKNAGKSKNAPSQ